MCVCMRVRGRSGERGRGEEDSVVCICVCCVAVLWTFLCFLFLLLFVIIIIGIHSNWFERYHSLSNQEEEEGTQRVSLFVSSSLAHSHLHSLFLSSFFVCVTVTWCNFGIWELTGWMVLSPKTLHYKVNKNKQLICFYSFFSANIPHAWVRAHTCTLSPLFPSSSPFSPSSPSLYDELQYFYG